MDTRTNNLLCALMMLLSVIVSVPRAHAVSGVRCHGVPALATELTIRLSCARQRMLDYDIHSHVVPHAAAPLDTYDGHPRYRIFATREGLVGHTTANGHVIRHRDHFVALPSRTALCPNDRSRKFEVIIFYHGRQARAPVWDVGPRNTNDNYWDQNREMWKDLALGMPETQAAYQRGYNRGKDQFGNRVTNPAGIDLADGTFWDDLKMTGNDWVDVVFLWKSSGGISPGEGAPNSSIKSKFKAAYNRGDNRRKLGAIKKKVTKCQKNSGVTGKQGWYQRCANGSIMYRKGDGKAFALYGVDGGFYKTWDTLGNQHGPLGFPRSDKYSTSKSRYGIKGVVQKFEGGRIYNTSKWGRHAVYGKIFDHYEKAKGLSGYLGFPVGDSSSGKTLQHFEGGYIFLDRGRCDHPRFARTSGTVWQIFGGQYRRAFSKGYQFNKWVKNTFLKKHSKDNPFAYVVDVSQSRLDDYEKRGAMDLLVRANGTIFFAYGGKKYPIDNTAAFKKRGFDSRIVCDTSLNLPRGHLLKENLSNVLTIGNYPTQTAAGGSVSIEWRMDGVTHNSPTKMVYRIDGGGEQYSRAQYQCGLHRVRVSGISGSLFEFRAMANVAGETLTTAWHQIEVGAGGASSVTITDGPSGDANPCAPGAQVQCSVSAEDSRGHDLIYSWTAEDSGDNAAGSFDDATKQNPIWTAPENDTALVAEYEISVTVTCAQDQGVNASGSYTQQVAPVLHSISGTVTDSDGNELEGVTVSADGKLATTAGDGTYTIDGLVADTYTVTPSKSEWVFEPASRDITVNAAEGNASGVDFTGFAPTSVPVSLARGWNIITLGQANDTTVTFGELLGNNAIAVYAWDGGNQEYVQIALTDPISVLPSGYGVWVLMYQAETVAIPIKIPPDPDPNPVNLYRGWNLLGNPFPVEIYLGPNLKPTSGDDTLNDGYVWLSPPGEYAEATSVTACEGVWVLAAVAEEAAPLAAEFNLQPAPPPGATSVAAVPLQRRPQVPEGSTWIQLAARSGASVDAGNWFGVTTESLARKRPKPPPAPSGLILYLDTEDYGVGYGTCIVPQNQRDHVWQVVVQSQSGQEVELYLPDSSRLPGELAVWLEDVATGQKTDLRHAQGYSYKAHAGGRRQFKLWLGTHTRSLQIMGVTTQATAAGGYIAYTLSAEADVTIEIRNISGRLISRIPCGVSAAGINTATWNLRNRSGAPVPSGTYLCSITARADDGTQMRAIRTMTLRR